MKKEVGSTDELRAEYDLSELLKDGVGGKHEERYNERTNLVLLSPDVAAVFRDGESVNETLRLVIQSGRIPQRDRQQVAKP